MKTYLHYPPRKLQSETYAGPITLSQYERFQYVRDMLGRRASSCRCRRETEFRQDKDEGITHHEGRCAVGQTIGQDCEAPVVMR